MLDSISQVGCYVDSYYEYIYKAWYLFGDHDLKTIWETSHAAINKYIAQESDTSLWYGVVNAYTGTKIKQSITLWDAYFPALLIYSGDTAHAEKSQKSWNYLWNKNGIIPVSYNYANDKVLNAKYYLNPELIESIYYLWHFTHNQNYMNDLITYYNDLKKYCRTDIAYTNLENVETKKQMDGLPSYFFAETMKYFFLAFSNSEINPETYVFSTEAHPYNKAHFNQQELNERLGIK
jgi:hypothetical protein